MFMLASNDLKPSVSLTLDNLKGTLLQAMKKKEKGLELVTTLIEKIGKVAQPGFDINEIQDEKGITPLHFVSQYGDKALMAILRPLVKNFNVVDKAKNNAAHFAASNKKNPDIIDDLNTEGVDFNHTNTESVIPCHVAASHGNIPILEKILPLSTIDDSVKVESGLAAAANPDVEVIKYLSQHNIIDVHKGDGKGIYPVHNAANSTVLEFLAEQKVDVNVQDEKERTPLHKMVHDLKCIEILLNNGANPMRQDEGGRTPGRYAVNNDSLAVLKALYQVAPETLRTKDWVTKKKEHLEKHHIVGKKKGNFLLIEDSAPFHVAMSEGHLHSIKFLAKEDLDLHVLDMQKRSVVARGIDTRAPNDLAFQALIENLPISTLKKEILWIIKEVNSTLQVPLKNIGEKENKKYTANGKALLTSIQKIYKLLFKVVIQHKLLLDLDTADLTEMFEAIVKNYETLKEKKKDLAQVDCLNEFWEKTLGGTMNSIAASATKPAVKNKAAATKDKTAATTDKKICSEEEIDTANKILPQCKEMISLSHFLQEKLGEKFAAGLAAGLENSLKSVKKLQKTNEEILQSVDMLANMSIQDEKQQEAPLYSSTSKKPPNELVEKIKESNEALSAQLDKPKEMDSQVSEYRMPALEEINMRATVPTKSSPGKRVGESEVEQKYLCSAEKQPKLTTGEPTTQEHEVTELITTAYPLENEVDTMGDI